MGKYRDKNNKKMDELKSKLDKPYVIPILGEGFYSSQPRYINRFDYLEDISSEKYASYRMQGDKKVRCKPRKHEHPIDMWFAALSYFDEMKENNLPITFSGLCFAIGYASRYSLDKAGKADDFKDVLTDIKLICEEFAETQLYSPNSNGARFSLSHSWGKADDADSIMSIELNLDNE